MFITAAPVSPRAGLCLTATVQARIGLMPASVGADTAVGLTVTPTGAARFYSNATCTTSTMQATIAAGTSTATFYVKPISGVPTTMTAAAPFGSAQQGFTPLPVVRRGSCNFGAPPTLPDGGQGTPDLFSGCTISPPQTFLANTFVMHTLTSQTDEAASMLATCFLADATTVQCRREGGSERTDIQWQTVELPTGLSVQTLRSTCGASISTLTLGQAVNPASSFVLKSVEISGSNDFDDEDSATMRLTGPTTVLMEHDNCTDYVVQVVDLSGVSVTRGALDAGYPAGVNNVTLSGLPPASPNTAVLVQARTTLSTTTFECALMLRAELPSPSSLSLSRGAGTVDAGCELDPIEQVVWERIDFGSRGTVYAHTAMFPTGTTVVTTSISPVDTTRTIVFASSQSVSGPSGGESAPQGELDDAVVRIELLNATSVRLTRSDQDGPANYTFYVVELEP